MKLDTLRGGGADSIRAPVPALSPISLTSALRDPSREPAWDEQVLAHAEHTPFFSQAWARVLTDSYAYRPCYLTAPFTGARAAQLPLMEIDTWVTGRRGVSLPFTDECRPLTSSPEQARALIERAIALGRERRWKTLEIHGGGELYDEVKAFGTSFHGHVVDLRKSPETLLQSFEGSIRRGIRTAEREQVKVQRSQSVEALRSYYGLHCLTRKRHGLPPQPWHFFYQIYQHILANNAGFVLLAKHQDRIIAGAVYFHFGKAAVYKYGASDFAFQSLRPNNLVMWEAIQWLNRSGFETLNLGRTSLQNEGLRRFKQGWGSTDYPMWYLKYDYRLARFTPVSDAAHGWHNTVFERLPVSVLKAIGHLLYRYCG